MSEDPLQRYLKSKANEVADYLREHTNIAQPQVTITISDGLVRPIDNTQQIKRVAP